MTSEGPKLLTIKEAAKLLCVTTLTLRNWDKAGKLTALRHPLNNYRVYRRDDVDKLLSAINENTKPVQIKSKKSVRKLSVKHLEEE